MPQEVCNSERLASNQVCFYLFYSCCVNEIEQHFPKDVVQQFPCFRLPIVAAFDWPWAPIVKQIRKSTAEL